MCMCPRTHSFLTDKHLKAYAHVQFRAHTLICKQAQCPLLFISVISARLVASSYLFLFQIMNFVTKLLHACTYFFFSVECLSQALSCCSNHVCFERSSVSRHGLWCSRREETFVSANEFEPLSSVSVFI